MGEEAVELLRAILSHFVPPPRLGALSRIVLFRRWARQMEAWFAGEIMYVLEREVGRRVAHWWPQVRYNGANARRMCDFVVELRDGPEEFMGVEVKVGCVGPQGPRYLRERADGTLYVEEGPTQDWRLEFLLAEGQGENGGVRGDAIRLRRSRFPLRVCLVFAYGQRAHLPDDAAQHFVEALDGLGHDVQDPGDSFRAELIEEARYSFEPDAVLLAFACLITPIDE